MKKEILRQLKSDYEKLEIQPSSDLWDRMQLGKENIPSVSHKNSFQWWKYAAVVLLLISLGSLFYFNFNKAEENRSIVKTGNPLKSTPAKSDVEIINSDKMHTENSIAVTPNDNRVDKAEENKKRNITSQEDLNSNSLVLAAEEKVSTNDLIKNQVSEEKITSPDVEKPVIAERKKASYIKADELLLGREFDKTRDETRNHHKTFGVLELKKIKIKTPNSFKILGMTVFSDSLQTK
jgi:hypothetical protein